jgi:HAMP domain-containing protein
VPIARANAAFQTFMVSLTLVFALVFVALNLMLSFMVIRPVSQLSRLADQLSQGEDIDAPDFEVKGNDEIDVLAQSFNRMKKSLVEAMRMLEAPARPT